MAAMRKQENIDVMLADKNKHLTLSMKKIPVIDRNHVVNVDRQVLSNKLLILRIKEFFTELGLTKLNLDDIKTDIIEMIISEMEKSNSKKFKNHVMELIMYLYGGNKPPLVSGQEVLFAMINASSDSTKGDKVMAGKAYIIAKEYNHPMASKILNGSLKIDALIPRVYKRLIGRGKAGYVPSTRGELLKADTLYLPTNLSLDNLSHRALIIHELTHANEDFEVTLGKHKLVNEIDMEMRAYKAQVKYIIDHYVSKKSFSELAKVIVSHKRSDPLFYWAYISVLKRNITTHKGFLDTISNAKKDRKLLKIKSDLSKPLTEIDKKLRAGIINLTGRNRRKVYSKSKNILLEGNAGHFYHGKL
ncbi:hypothetical protein [Aquimarina mytili]|uniref:Uncharacterized protein n=1 Tax=Aquimarina mytili TaxID=874423 RepID=A0A937D9L3_9FLAO|nr:hypothetical protein [Aquimarina mytili]MBL0683832.1 hypothetical protein [Aquimarina mytili]